MPSYDYAEPVHSADIHAVGGSDPLTPQMIGAPIDLPDRTNATTETVPVNTTTNCATAAVTKTAPGLSTTVPPQRFSVKNTSTGIVKVTYPNSSGTSVTDYLEPDEVRTYRQKNTSGWGTEEGNTPWSAIMARIRQASLLPTSAIAETCRRMGDATSNTVSVASGQARGVAVEHRAGEKITSLTYESGGTVCTTYTHQWAALLDNTFKVIGVSADATTGAWAADDEKVFTLSAPYTATYTGLFYYVKCVVFTGSAPTSRGFTSSPTTSQNGITGPVLSGQAAGQTTPPLLASTLTLVEVQNVDYGYSK